MNRPNQRNVVFGRADPRGAVRWLLGHRKQVVKDRRRRCRDGTIGRDPYPQLASGVDRALAMLGRMMTRVDW